jgi:Protein of unknown function (DUF1579)
MKTTGLLTTLTMATLAMAAATATAQGPKPAAGSSPAPTPAAAPAPPPGLPKPPGELDQIKWIEGNWRCDGKAPAGPMGPEHAYKSTMRIKRALDGFWYANEYEQKKSKENPVAIKASSFLGFDPVAKKVVSVGADNLGGALQLSGTIEGDKISNVGEGSMGGQKVGFKEIMTKAGDRALTWHGEVRMGKDWVVVGDETCKR